MNTIIPIHDSNEINFSVIYSHIIRCEINSRSNTPLKQRKIIKWIEWKPICLHSIAGKLHCSNARNRRSELPTSPVNTAVLHWVRWGTTTLPWSTLGYPVCNGFNPSRPPFAWRKEVVKWGARRRRRLTSNLRPRRHPVYLFRCNKSRV